MAKTRYQKAPYSPPEPGAVYSVRDKSRRARIIRVVEKSPDGDLVQVEILDDGKPTGSPIQLTVDSLAREAAKDWCSLLIPVASNDVPPVADSEPPAAAAPTNVTMRLDIQNFSRCCADIVRANIRFDTQLIKDIGDGPFKAGNYERAFLNLEQFALHSAQQCRAAAER